MPAGAALTTSSSDPPWPKAGHRIFLSRACERESLSGEEASRAAILAGDPAVLGQPSRLPFKPASIMGRSYFRSAESKLAPGK